MKFRALIAGFVMVILISVPISEANEQLEVNDGMTNSSNTVTVSVNNTCGEEGCPEGLNLGGTTYVPLRAVLETMGATVVWNENTRTVDIRSKQQNESEQASDELNNDVSDADEEERVFEQDTTKLLLDIQLLKDQLYAFDQQMQLAKEFYTELGDTAQIRILEGLRYERIESYRNILDQYLSYEKQYPENTTRTGEVYSSINVLKDVLDQYQLSVQSLDRYASDQDQEQLKLYLMSRKHAYDKLEELEVNIHRYFKDNIK